MSVRHKIQSCVWLILHWIAACAIFFRVTVGPISHYHFFFSHSFLKGWAWNDCCYFFITPSFCWRYWSFIFLVFYVEYSYCLCMNPMDSYNYFVVWAIYFTISVGDHVTYLVGYGCCNYLQFIPVYVWLVMQSKEVVKYTGDSIESILRFNYV